MRKFEVKKLKCLNIFIWGDEYIGILYYFCDFFDLFFKFKF